MSPTCVLVIFNEANWSTVTLINGTSIIVYMRIRNVAELVN